MGALEEKYDVITAPSVEKMLKVLENNSPDIILLGPGITLPETAAKPAAGIPVVSITEPFDHVNLVSSVESHFLLGS
jgi:ABC-type Fe3+-hydroxamate transport system substrate-binding protein